MVQKQTDKESERVKVMIKQRSLLAFIVLSIVTCGIYPIFFFYSWTNDVNLVCAGDGEDSLNYIVVLILSFVTCGIYGIYWIYKQANRLAKNGPRYGVVIVENGGTVLMWYLVGSLVCGLGSFVGLHILIKNLNTLANIYNQNNGTPNATGNTYVQQTIVVQGTVQEESVVQETSKFCGQCGNTIEAQDQFCAKCGSKKDMGITTNNTQTSSAPINGSQMKDAATNFMQNISSANIGNILFGIVGVVFIAMLINYNVYYRGYVSYTYIIFRMCLPMLCVIGFAVLAKFGNNIKKEYKLLPYAAFCFLEFLNYLGIPEMLIYGYSMSEDWSWRPATQRMGIVFMAIIFLAVIVVFILNAIYASSADSLQNVQISKIAEKIQLAVICATLALTIGTVINVLYALFSYFNFSDIFWHIMRGVFSIGRILPLVLVVFLDNQEYIKTKLGKM